MKIIESAIRGFEIRNKAQGIQNPTNNYNPESKYHRQRLQSSTWIPESTAWNQEFKTDMDFFAWVEVWVCGKRAT